MRHLDSGQEVERWSPKFLCYMARVKGKWQRDKRIKIKARKPFLKNVHVNHLKCKHCYIWNTMGIQDINDRFDFGPNSSESECLQMFGLYK